MAAQTKANGSARGRACGPWIGSSFRSIVETRYGCWEFSSEQFLGACSLRPSHTARLWDRDPDPQRYRDRGMSKRPTSWTRKVPGDKQTEHTHYCVMQNVRRLFKGRPPASLVPGSQDASAAMRSKFFGGYLYPARQFEFYKPPSRKALRSGSETKPFSRNALESSWMPGYGAFAELPRREIVGAHTFFLFIGFDELIREFYEKLWQRTGMPEAAVIAVRSEQVGQAYF